MPDPFATDAVTSRPGADEPLPPGSPAPRIAWIHLAPVKGLALVQLDSVALERSGPVGNRRFYLIDAEGRLVNGKRIGPLTTVVPSYQPDAGEGFEQLQLTFPDMSVVKGTVELGEWVTTSFFGRPVQGRLVLGQQWSRALSEFAGVELRLVRACAEGAGVDRGQRAVVSLLSRASLARLSQAVGTGTRLDARRFRMLLGVSGAAAHEEDTWIGRPVRVGGAVVVPGGNVGRCVVTSQDPATGLPDLDTLGALRTYRRDWPTTEKLSLGVWGEVVSPGVVSLGDTVVVE